MADFTQKIACTIDINSGLVITPQRTQLRRGDKNANKIVVTVVDGKKNVDLTGVTASGRFYRPPNEDEVPLSGSVSGNVVTVVLNDHCYTEEGYYEADVVLTQGTIKRTILTISGNVHAAGSGVYIDVENVVPSVDDIVALYAEMRAETDRCTAAADRAEQMQIDASGLAGDSNKLAGFPPAQYCQPVDLLTNSDFAINQRGKSVYSGAVYGPDRWRSSNSRMTLTVHDGYVNMAASDAGTAYYRQEMPYVLDGKYTLAILVRGSATGSLYLSVGKSAGDSSIGAGSVSYNVASDDWTAFSGVLDTDEGTADAVQFSMSVSAGKNCDVKRVALFRGAYTTDMIRELMFAPKKPAEELAECQRFLYRNNLENRVINGYFTGSSEKFAMPWLHAMRFSDYNSIDVTASGIATFRGVSGYAMQDVDLSACTFTQTAYGILLTPPADSDGNASVFSAGNNTPGVLAFPAGAYIELSCEL